MLPAAAIDEPADLFYITGFKQTVDLRPHLHAC
jgi:hypothetical protein